MKKTSIAYHFYRPHFILNRSDLLISPEKERKENEDSFIEETQRVRSCNEICIDTKLDTTRKFKHLALRRRDILTELSDIFPITVVYTDKENKCLILFCYSYVLYVQESFGKSISNPIFHMKS